MAALGLLLAGFTPFTAVTNVCPKCPTAKTDVIVLTSGVKVAGNVVAHNAAFYVIERYGEYRAVTKTEVSSVEWKGKGGPGNLGTGDQILLKNNVVLHGAITQEVPGRYFEIQVGTLKHIIWHSQIQSVHKAGTLHPITTAPPPPG